MSEVPEVPEPRGGIVKGFLSQYKRESVLCEASRPGMFSGLPRRQIPQTLARM